jgi:diguanylate cyclase (GGDEF)-like protein/PAS domain S-box-containing protein
LAIHYFYPNINISRYDIITNIYLCIAVNIASCLILYRYQRMVKQVEQELAMRLSFEQALQQVRVTLEERVAERTADLEKTNQEFVLEILERERIEDELKKAYEYLENIFDNSADGIGIVDHRGNFTKWNKAAAEIYGYNSEDLLGKPAFNLYTNSNELDRMLTQLHQEGFVRNYEIDMKRKDGSIITCSLSIKLLHSNDHKIIGSVAVARDLTEIRDTLANLKLVNEKLQDLIIASDHRNRQMAMIQEMGEVLQVCQTLEEIHDAIAHFAAKFFPGFSGALYTVNNSKNFFERVATWGETPPQELAFGHDECWALRQSRVNLVDSSASLLRCRHVSSPLSFGYLCVPMMAQGEALGILHLQTVSPDAESQMHAASQLASTVAEGMALALANIKLREILRDQAIRDPLTGLFNRRYITETFERELARAQRHSDSLGVIMIDLDKFKNFNDNFGHETGDKLLVTFGDFITNIIRKEDIACRWGGEEFFLILPGASLKAGLERAEEIRFGAKQLQVPTGKPHRPVTLSLGIAVYPEHGVTTDELIKAADTALYWAKQAGRDRVMAPQRLQNQHPQFYPDKACVTQ